MAADMHTLMMAPARLSVHCHGNMSLTTLDNPSGFDLPGQIQSHHIITAVAGDKAMPKIRNRRAQHTTLSVSPWHAKKGHSEGKQPPTLDTADAHHQQQQAPLMYSVVLSGVPLQPQTAADSSKQHAQADQLPAASVSRPAVPQAEAAGGSSSGGGWHTVSRRAAAAHAGQQQQAQPQDQQLLHNSSVQQCDRRTQQQAAIDDMLSVDKAASDSSGASGDSSSSSAALQGVAQLMLLPTGAIVGHFVATGGSASQQQQQQQVPRLHLGLQGRQVLGIHSCYQDPEWALLEMTLTRHSSSSSKTSSSSSGGTSSRHSGSGAEDADDDTAAQAAAAAEQDSASAEQAWKARWQHTPAGSQEQREQQEQQEQQQQPRSLSQPAPPAEAVAWVQRSGGDLVCLAPADVDDEDTQAAMRAANLGMPPACGTTLHFTGHTLLAGQAAAGLLARMGWGGLAGAAAGEGGVVVNVGDMSVAGLPPGFAG